MAHAFQDWRIPAFGPEQLDPNIRPMSSYVANAGVEFQVAPQLMVAARYIHNSLRTTIEDIGPLVDGSEVYIYANPGEGLAKMTSPSSDFVKSFEIPKPKRTYDALEFSFTRRFANRWFASGSYVYSRLWGDYAGLQNSDEVQPGSTYLGSSPSQQASSSSVPAWQLGHARLRPGLLHVRRQGESGRDRPPGFRPAARLEALRQLHTALEGRRDPTRRQLPCGQRDADDHLCAGCPEHSLSWSMVAATWGARLSSPTPICCSATAISVAEGKRIRLEFNAQNLFNQKISQYTYPLLQPEPHPQFRDEHGLRLYEGLRLQGSGGSVPGRGKGHRRS